MSETGPNLEGIDRTFNQGRRDLFVRTGNIGKKAGAVYVTMTLAPMLIACTPSFPAPQEIAGEITSHKDGSAVKETDELSGTMSGTRSSGDSFWVIEREIGDPLLRMHPQGQGKNGDEPVHEIDVSHWVASAKFGFAGNAEQPGNTDRDVPFDVLLVYATRSATMKYQKYFRDSKAAGNFPGITALYPDSHIVAQVSVHRLPLTAITQGEGYRLTSITEEGQPILVDQQLEKAGGVIGRLRFQYDTAYRPTDPNGAIGLTVVRSTEGPVRIMSEELKPNPRFLFNDACPYFVKAGEKLYRWPVIDLGAGDSQRIYVGSNQNTYQSMRVYEIQREGEGLVGSFVGMRDMDPANIHPEQTPKPCPTNFPAGII